MKDLTEGIWEAIAKLENGADAADVAGDLRVLVSPDVLPCPCCGAEVELYDSGHWEKQIKCTECGLSSGVGPADEVINAWNKRVKKDDGTEDGSVRQDQQ
jgi:hypothetical protein